MRVAGVGTARVGIEERRDASIQRVVVRGAETSSSEAYRKTTASMTTRRDGEVAGMECFWEGSDGGVKEKGEEGGREGE